MVPEYYIKSSVESHIKWATSHSASAESITVGLAEHTLPAKSLFCIKKTLQKGFRSTGIFNNSEPNNLWFLTPCMEFCFPLLTYRRSHEQGPLLNYSKTYKKVLTYMLVKKATISQEKHLRKWRQDERFLTVRLITKLMWFMNVYSRMPLGRYNLTNIQEWAKVLLYCSDDTRKTCRHIFTYSKP